MKEFISWATATCMLLGMVIKDMATLDYQEDLGIGLMCFSCITAAIIMIVDGINESKEKEDETTEET